MRDRVVQAALRLVIEPIFEKEFAPHSYGFRPKRGCKDALREVDRLLKAGYTHVVDADLKAYFDSIPHERLMAGRRPVHRRWARAGADRRISQAGHPGGIDPVDARRRERPQGAVISPLLANLYLHPVDEAMAAAGYRDDPLCG